MTFSNVFGGGTLTASEVAYRAVSLTSSVSLVWPPLSVAPTDFVARIMDVTPSGPGFTITMPPANQVSAGYDILFTNKGANSYSVLNNAGATLVTVAAGQQIYLYVTDNSTQAGLWTSFLFGAGSSAISAAAVQGFGILAIGNTLNQSHNVILYSASKTIVASDRATVQVWTGGAGTLTLPTIASIGSVDFFFEFANRGTGTLTIVASGGQFLDGSASITIQPSETGFIHGSNASDWYSVGRGRSVQFNFSQLVKTVTGGTDTLTQTEAANTVQKYIGNLTSNETVVVPATVQVYYVTNATTGNFTFTMQTPTPGSVVTIPQGNSVILFSDGVNITQANNTLSTNVSNLILNAGTNIAPSLTFVGNPSSGLYAPVPGGVAVSANGLPAIVVSPSGQVSISNINITGGTISGVTIPNAPVPDFLLINQGII